MRGVGFLHLEPVHYPVVDLAGIVDLSGTVSQPTCILVHQGVIIVNARGVATGGAGVFDQSNTKQTTTS